MARTVRVGLDVDEQPFVRGVGRAEKATEKLDDALDGVTGSAKDTAAGMGKAKDQIGDTGDAARKAGRDLAGLARDADRLDRQIDDTTHGIRDLARAIAAASDEADRAKLGEKLKVEQGKQRDMVNLRKLLGNVTDDAGREGDRAGSSFASRMGDVITRKLARLGEPIGSALSASFSSMPPQAQAAVGAAVAGLVLAAAPLAGAAISAALIGGAGTGGIVGGLVLASKDPRVKAEAKGLGEAVGELLGDASESFVPVTIGALGKVRKEIVSWEPELRAIFEAASRYVDPLTDGALGFIDEFLPGLLKAVEAGEPFFEMLSEELPELGADLGEFFAMAAEHADEAASAAGFLLDYMGAVVAVVGHVADKLASVYGTLVKVKNFFTGDDGMEYSFKRLAAPIGDVSVGLLDANKASRIADEGLKLYNDTLRDFATAAISSWDAETRFEEAIDAATDAAKNGKDTLDKHTDAGRKNRNVLGDLASATLDAAEQVRGLAGGQAQANAIMDRGYEKFVAAADSMGISRSQADKLARSLGLIPSPKVSVTVNTAQGKKAIASINTQLNNINGKTVKTYIKVITQGGFDRVTSNTGGGRSINRWGGIYEHAQEGVLREADIFAARSPARYAFAEPATGGEAFVPRFGDRERSLAILDQAAGWYGKTLASRVPTYMGQPGAGGMRVVNVTYNIPVSVAAGANPAEGGRQVVEQIRAYEHNNGRGWRS